MLLAHYADGSKWEFALCLDPRQETANYTQLDERAAWAIVFIGFTVDIERIGWRPPAK